MFTIHSSNGTLVADIDGNVIVEQSTYDNDELVNIKRFNLDEYREYWKDNPSDSIDILDLGYWTIDGEYEEPCFDWREEVKKELGL